MLVTLACEYPRDSLYHAHTITRPEYERGLSTQSSEAVTPRERGNERHDVLARHTDTCHTLVTCHVSRVKCHGGGHFVKTLTAPPMLNIAGHTHIGLSIH